MPARGPPNSNSQSVIWCVHAGVWVERVCADACAGKALRPALRPANKYRERADANVATDTKRRQEAGSRQRRGPAAHWDDPACTGTGGPCGAAAPDGTDGPKSPLVLSDSPCGRARFLCRRHEPNSHAPFIRPPVCTFEPRHYNDHNNVRRGAGTPIICCTSTTQHTGVGRSGTGGTPRHAPAHLAARP